MSSLQLNNYIDIIIIILFIWAAVRGFRKGMLMMLATLAALVIGIWGAIKFSNLTAGWLSDFLDVTWSYMGLVSFTVTFLCIVIIINIAGYLANRLLDAIALGFFNRILGSVFSIFKMGLILSVIFVILNSFNEKHGFLPEDDIRGSTLYQPVAGFAPSLFPSLSFSELRKELERLIL